MLSQMAANIITEMKDAGWPLEIDTLNNALNTLTSANQVHQGITGFH